MRLMLAWPIPTVAVAILAASAVPSTLAAQVTYTACRVPDVGAIYMIQLPPNGLPDQCLDTSHVMFQWTEDATLPDGSVTTAKLADGAVTQAKLDSGISIGVAPGAIGTTELADGSVTPSKLAIDAVTSGAILDGAVGSADVADNSLTASDLAANSVTGTELADATVTAAKIVPLSITGAEIANDAVSSAEMQDGSVTFVEFEPGLFQWARIAADGSVTGSSGSVSATRPSTGQYEITFPASLGTQASCALLGTANASLFVVLVQHGLDVAGLTQFQARVQVLQPTVGLVNSDFSILAMCT